MSGKGKKESTFDTSCYMNGMTFVNLTGKK